MLISLVLASSNEKSGSRLLTSSGAVVITFARRLYHEVAPHSGAEVVATLMLQKMDDVSLLHREWNGHRAIRLFIFRDTNS